MTSCRECVTFVRSSKKHGEKSKQATRTARVFALPTSRTAVLRGSVPFIVKTFHLQIRTYSAVTIVQGFDDTEYLRQCRNSERTRAPPRLRRRTAESAISHVQRGNRPEAAVDRVRPAKSYARSRRRSCLFLAVYVSLFAGGPFNFIDSKLPECVTRGASVALRDSS